MYDSTTVELRADMPQARTYLGTQEATYAEALRQAKLLSSMVGDGNFRAMNRFRVRQLPPQEMEWMFDCRVCGWPMHLTFGEDEQWHADSIPAPPARVCLPKHDLATGHWKKEDPDNTAISVSSPDIEECVREFVRELHLRLTNRVARISKVIERIEHIENKKTP